MKELNDLFEKDFVLRVKANFSGGYAQKIDLETLTKDSTKDNAKKLHKEVGDGRLPNYLYLGNHSYEQEYIAPVGRLALVPVYSQHADDMMGLYYSRYEGFALVDRNQKIVYSNTKTTDRVFDDKNDVLNLVYVYGPCAMVYLEPQQIDKAFSDKLKQVYNDRAKTLTDRQKDPQKIEQEKELFNKALNILETENKKLLDSNLEF